MAYSESYIVKMERTTLNWVLEGLENGNGVKPNPYNIQTCSAIRNYIFETTITPPEALEAEESPTALDKLLLQASTREERALVRLIGKLLDSAWRFTTRKALRGELRRNFIANGFTKNAYYIAFRSLEQKVNL